MQITVNGERRELSADPEMPLLWLLRDKLHLRGTKYGCGVGICGICTVLLDGEPNHACMVPARKADGGTVITIEGLAQGDHPLIKAWIDEQVPQCGYCQPGQVMAAAALLSRKPDPSDAEIADAMSGVLCRCGTYQRVHRAIREAVAQPEDASHVVSTGLPDRASDVGVALNPWLRIHGDNSVTIVINHSEMGQGVTTGLAMLVAEELEVDLDRIHTEFAPADPRYVNPRFGIQLTGGSTAVRGEWEQLRKAGASARLMLLDAAARQWRVPAKDCMAKHGQVMHAPSARALNYSDLAPSAAKLKPPRRVELKPVGDWRLIGRAVPRLEIPDMVCGRTTYGSDLALSDMRVASVERPPAIGARATFIDADVALAIPGVHSVHELESGVAVVAEDTWAALRGRAVLRVNWDRGAHSSLNAEALYEQLRQRAQRSAKVSRRRGSTKRALDAARQTVEATYRTSYLAHATLETMNCVAHVREDGCEVWIGTQSQTDTQKTAARLTGLPKDRVKVHSQFMGGAFGRRLETDVVVDAVELARKIRQPVQVLCTRQDDLQHDFYRPAHYTRLKAALNFDGRPTVWWQRVVGPSLALDMVDVPYDIPNLREEHAEIETPVPTGAWRAVGAGQNAFVVEGFIDELAHAAGEDPLTYRMNLLAHSPRHQRVLALAAEQAGWDQPLQPLHGRGVAVYRSFGSWVAEVAEVAMVQEKIQVQRVVCAVDCGLVVNPDTVRAQMEGAIAFGLSAALHEEVCIENGAVQQATFADYPILTFSEMPQVEVHIVESLEPPGGVGEPGLPPLAPAVANAVFTATGRRLRELPLRP